MKYSASVHSGFAEITIGNAGPYTSTDAAEIVEALWRDGHRGAYVFRYGKYLFGRMAIIPESDIEIVIEVGAQLAANNSDAVGIFNITGDRVRVSGPGRVVIDNAVNDQVAILFNGGDDVAVDGVSFEAFTTGASDANPMTMTRFDSCYNVRMEGCVAIPKQGFRILHVLDTEEYAVRDNTFRKPYTAGFARCWRPVDVQDSYGGRITGNTFRALGNSSNIMAGGCLVLRETTVNSTAAGDIISGNRFESIGARNVIKVLGRASTIIRDCVFVDSSPSITTYDYENVTPTRYDATVLFHNMNESVSAATNEYCAHATVDGCLFDNGASSTACEIIVKSLAKGSISNNWFAHQSGRHSIVVDADHSYDIKVDGNHFDGGFPTVTTQKVPVRILNRLTEDASGEEAGSYTSVPLYTHIEGITLTGNKAEGWKQCLSVAGGGLDWFPLPLGARGGLSCGVDGWREVVASANITFTNPDTITASSGTPFGNVAPGDMIMVLGADDQKNNGLRRVLTATSSELTVANPSADNNSDPTENSDGGWEIQTDTASALTVIYVYPRGPHPSSTATIAPLQGNASHRYLLA